MGDLRALIKRRYPQIDGLNADIVVAIVELLGVNQTPVVRLAELRDKWIGIFHTLSNNHFGDHDAEHIANTYRACAEELNAAISRTTY